MESSCVRQTLLPGTSKLLGDYLYHFDRVERFFSWSCEDAESFSRAAAQIQYPDSRRAALVSALRQQNGDSPALAKLAQPGTVAVVTGQQVGLFSGPAYTLFKALTAVKLARDLSNRGIPAVPIFWLATEDHDLAEVNHAWVFNHLGEPQQIVLENAVSSGGPVGRIPLGRVHFEKLREALGEFPFASDVITQVEQAYQPDATLGSAFKSLVRSILKDFDLLYLDPLSPAIREIATSFLSEAVHHIPQLTEALRERNRELETAGYHAQVHIDKEASLLFVMSEGKRLPLRWKEGRFVVSRDRAYSVADLQARGDQISPNALLRPVMQDYLIPTVSYVGGPAEIAYMAQAQVLYDGLLGRMPVIFPRNSFTLLDARSVKLLDRYSLRVPDVLVDQETLRAQLASRLIPASLHHEFARVRESTESSLAYLQSQLIKFDSTLAVAARKSSAKMLYQLEKLSKKTAREAMRRDERAANDARYLANAIYPHRHLQERFYSIVPFLAKHGPDLPQRLMDEVQLACSDHMLRVI